ncbi:MAG: Hsp20 family protein, partial [Candidatus Fonsibacter sp.]|nr:Hsp20 family protein [Candidatus Fonsibacter sp.]
KQLFNGSTKFFDDSFESIFDTWSKVQSFPFYNVVKYSKGKYGLEIGLAGYNKENILVEVKDGILTVEGKTSLFKEQPEYIKQGLAYREFFKQFQLAKDAIVDEAEMKDGILKIKFGFKEPKEIEGIKINIK